MKLEPNWEYVTDGVMGGVSRGALAHEVVHGRPAVRLTGTVSLENNGGFLQMAFDFNADGGVFDASAWRGIALDLTGNDEDYEVRLRTDRLSRPWQSYRAVVHATRDWQTFELPFQSFQPHRTEEPFAPQALRRMGVVAVGRAFSVDVAVAAVRFYP